VAEHNQAFAIAAQEEGTAFVPDRLGAWREILCIVEERTVGNDNTVAWNGRRLQLRESRLRPHFVKAAVRVHEYPDGGLSVFLGPHRLASYTAQGVEIVTTPTASSLAPCSGPSRPSPGGRAKGAALTAPAREALGTAWVGTKKRLQVEPRNCTKTRPVRPALRPPRTGEPRPLAPRSSVHEKADTSRATKTGQLDELATEPLTSRRLS
jgi:hypothetical protein